MQATLVVPRFGRCFLFGLVDSVPVGKVAEIYLVGVEFGAVDAGEFRFVVDRDPAAAAHAGAVDHDGVQADNGMDA